MYIHVGKIRAANAGHDTGVPSSSQASSFVLRAVGAVYEPMTFGGYQNLVAQQNTTTQQCGVWGRTRKWRMWDRLL
jgi:hypothetical protein